MHYGIGARAGKRSLNLQAVGQIAPNEVRPGIDCASMALAQVIEDGNLVTFIQQKLGANATDVARPPGKENSHGRGKCGGTRVKSKRSMGWRGLRDGFALLFLNGCDHLPRAMVFAARGKYFQTLFVRAPLQDVNVHVADAPAFHLEPARLGKVNGVRADQRSSVSSITYSSLVSTSRNRVPRG